MHFALIVSVAAAVLILSVGLGTYSARALRMPDHGWKLVLILFALFASTAVTAMRWPPKLGIDLSGGLILVYEVDTSSLGQGQQSVDMDKLIQAIIKRVNPGGQKEVTVRSYGPNQVQIIIPQVKDENEAHLIEHTISSVGTLEFRILANTHFDLPIIERAMRDENANLVTDAQGKMLAKWVPVAKEKIDDFAAGGYPDAARRMHREHGKEVLQVLVMNDPYNIRGNYLRRASADIDQSGKPCVRFNFDSTGGSLFGALTGANVPQGELTHKLGVMLNDELYTAPQLRGAIFDSGEITGIPTEEEVNSIVAVLNAGSLPATLKPEPISRLFTGPTLGLDTIQKSALAMIVASILVPLFMVWYYRFAGIVADVALVLNMLLLMAVMMSINARFTLTGLAGMALTVGMAVDNNVLVFERLREELERGATLRMAIRQAFHRAGSTIIDCNTTHLLAATVLYFIGSDQIKGFAVTLWLGCAISMFTSVFVAHVIFDIAEKHQWITQLKMLHLIKHTKIDFVRLFYPCAVASVLVTVLGVGIAFYRGKGLFDIDFTGGVSVQARFREPQKTEALRKVLDPKLSDLAITNVKQANEADGLQFEFNTSQPDFKVVQKVLKDTFGKQLVANTLQIAETQLIPAAAIPAQTPPSAVATPPAKPETKAEPKPETKPENKPAQPEKKAQSRADLPSDHEMALADNRLLPLLLADNKPADAKPAAPKADAKPDAKPAETKAQSKAAEAKAEPKPETKPAEAKAEPKPETKPAEAKAEPKPETKPAEKAPESKPAATAERFPGGTRTELTFEQPVNHDTVADLLAQALDANKVILTSLPEVTNRDYEPGSTQAFKTWKVEMPLAPEKAAPVLDALKRLAAETPYYPSSNVIGGAVAAGTRVQAVYALIASWGLIILYLWIRFQRVAFGVAAVVALIHDVLVMLGGVAVSYWIAQIPGVEQFLLIGQFKINLQIVAAFLTIIGYSVNDTIVVFDRIREVRGKDPNLTPRMINDSTNQTLSRTLLTSFTVFLVVIVLYVAGGNALRGFAFALIIGVATGTYSSIYVAAPILLWMIGHPQHVEKDTLPAPSGSR